MKVIIVNYRYFIAGGPEKYMFKFMEAAQKRGIEVIPFSVSNPRNEKTPYSKYFVKPRSDALLYQDMKFSVKNMYGMARATVWNFDAERRLRKLIRDTGPDAVYILHEINHLSPSVIRAAKKEGVRVVHRISDFFMFCAKYDFLYEDEICEACLHGNYARACKQKCVKGSGMGTLLRIFAMRIYAKLKIFEDVDHYICTCDFSKNKLAEGGIPEDKITCIPTFIDSSGITPSYSCDRYFLFLGRMARQKGVRYAVEAMKWLKDTGYVLKITGTLSDSREDMEIRNEICENGLENKVVFTGFLQGQELEELISRAACIVCPAIWYENMPNTVIEAYAHGKPVVASRIGSLAEIVDDNETGMLFEMKNSAELAKKLKMFTEDRTLSEKLGRNAREKCEKDYAEDIHMDRVIRVLEGA